jgi:hypothetical protein
MPTINLRTYQSTANAVHGNENGIEDDNKGVQGAIDAAIIKTRGGGVFIPASTYRISTTLHIQNVLGLKISGVSIGGNTLNLGWTSRCTHVSHAGRS